MAAEAAALPEADPLRPLAIRIVERLRIAHTLALPENFLPGVDLAGRRAPWLQRVVQPVRANLDVALAGAAPCAAHHGDGDAGAGVHHAAVQPVRPLADHHHRRDDAAVFRADLCARAGAGRRHRAGRPGGGGGRAGLHHAAGDRRGDVPAGGGGVRGARGEPRAVHGRADAADRAAGGDRRARHQRMVDRLGALRASPRWAGSSRSAPGSCCGRPGNPSAWAQEARTAIGAHGA